MIAKPGRLLINIINTNYTKIYSIFGLNFFNLLLLLNDLRKLSSGIVMNVDINIRKLAFRITMFSQYQWTRYMGCYLPVHQNDKYNIEELHTQNLEIIKGLLDSLAIKYFISDEGFL